MKAYEILMFLFIFSMMTWIVSDGLHIYNIHYDGDNPTSYDEYGVLTSRIFISITSGIVIGAVIGMVLKVRDASQKVIYSMFSAIFWASFIETAQIFHNIAASIPSSAGYAGGLVLLAVFFGIAAYVFIVGLMQMVTGGWKAYV